MSWTAAKNKIIRNFEPKSKLVLWHHIFLFTWDFIRWAVLPFYFSICLILLLLAVMASPLLPSFVTLIRSHHQHNLCLKFVANAICVLVKIRRRRRRGKSRSTYLKHIPICYVIWLNLCVSFKCPRLRRSIASHTISRF